MSELINRYVSEKKLEKCLQECLNSGNIYLGIILAKFLGNSEESKQLLSQLEEKKNKVIRVKLLCNWCTSEQLAKLWDKMSRGNFSWNTVSIVWSDPVDFYVIINHPPVGEVYDKKRTIVFQMEPHMDKNIKWKEWSNPDSKEFLKVCKHREGEYNNNEWHLSKTYSQLCSENILKNPKYNNVISAILSANYQDIGHVKRVDFVKFLEKKGLPVHVYGNNRWNYKDYKGSLPYHCKDEGILPYKYTFNGENNDISYYYTEKLIDGILGECLTFYWGCQNIKELIDPRAYIQLELSNFEKDYEIVKKAIEEDWHTQRLPYIQEAKRKILNELQFFPRLERILNNFKN